MRVRSWCLMGVTRPNQGSKKATENIGRESRRDWSGDGDHVPEPCALCQLMSSETPLSRLEVRNGGLMVLFCFISKKDREATIWRMDCRGRVIEMNAGDELGSHCNSPRKELLWMVLW